MSDRRIIRVGFKAGFLMKMALFVLCTIALSTPSFARPIHHKKHHHRHHHSWPGYGKHLVSKSHQEGAGWFDLFAGLTSQPDAETHRRSPGGLRIVMANGAGRIVSHPSGCPSRAFCGCGASVRVFGHSVRSLWLASNWYRFPRAAPLPGRVAVRRGHVFVLESHISGNVWQVWDANSGGHRTRIHPRSIAGFAIVDPRAV